VKVLGVGWVGVRTENVEESIHFFQHVLGFKVSRRDLDFAILQVSSGDTLEIFGPSARLSEPNQFDRNQVVVGLLVDDIDEARRAIEAAGATLLGEIERTPEGYAWQHFIGPDGNTWELTFDPARVASRRRRP
jgi:predicted enzyme related to lactoylglutathione lyase